MPPVEPPDSPGSMSGVVVPPPDSPPVVPPDSPLPVVPPLMSGRSGVQPASGMFSVACAAAGARGAAPSVSASERPAVHTIARARGGCAFAGTAAKCAPLAPRAASCPAGVSK